LSDDAISSPEILAARLECELYLSGEELSTACFLALKLGKPFPDILYDGIVDEKKRTPQGTLPDELRLCIRNNGDADFANGDLEHDFENIRRDLAPHDCAHPSHEPVKLTGITP